jgi:hypothetical protein
LNVISNRRTLMESQLTELVGFCFRHSFVEILILWLFFKSCLGGSVSLYATPPSKPHCMQEFSCLPCSICYPIIREAFTTCNFLSFSLPVCRSCFAPLLCESL